MIALLLSALVISALPAGAGEPSAVPDTKKLKELSLDELVQVEIPTVIGASKHEQKITEAPSAVSIVTRQDIEEHGYRTLADVLDGVRGLFTTFDRAYHFAGVRGVSRLGDYGGRLLINIDGHRTNEPAYDSALLGHDFPLDVDLIDRVEIIRGPGSALYGNNAFFGIVNVVTRRGRAMEGHGVEGSASYGSFDAHRGRLTYGRQLDNGVEMLVSGSYYHSDGNPSLRWTNPEFRGSNGGVVEDFDAEHARQFFTTASYGDLSFAGVYGRRDKDLPNAAYGSVFNDKRAELYDERAYAELRYARVLAGDWSVSARTYFDHYVYAGTFPYDYGTPGSPAIALNYDQATARFWGGEVQTSRTFWDRHRINVGGEGRHDAHINLLNRDVAPAFTYIDLTTSQGTVGVYVQDEARLRNNLTLNAGVRFDYFTTFGSTANPRAALIYQPWTPSTFKLLYGQAYRAPNAYEFSYESATYKANPDLKPETIRSYELVWEQSVARNYRVTGTVFYNQVNDLITQAADTDPSDPRFVFKNTDSVDVKGAEIELEGRWENGFRGRVSYSFAEALDDATGELLPNSPRHLGKLQLTAPLYLRKLFAGVELLAMSSRDTARGNAVPARAIVNLTLLGRRLIGGLDASASIYNLFDEGYCDPASPDFVQDTNPRDGRTFRLKLTYRF